MNVFGTAQSISHTQARNGIKLRHRTNDDYIRIVAQMCCQGLTPVYRNKIHKGLVNDKYGSRFFRFAGKPLQYLKRILYTVWIVGLTEEEQVYLFHELLDVL